MRCKLHPGPDAGRLTQDYRSGACDPTDLSAAGHSGGKLELGEDLSARVIREISEEADWQVTAGPVLDCWQYHISEGQDVVITYGCYLASTTPPVVSNEHKRAGLFTHGEVPDLNMPDGYKRSIMTWFARPAADRGQAKPSPPRWSRMGPAVLRWPCGRVCRLLWAA
jgi:8-oxo-dGTP pyrophosphatase MutT (NUDIX family)